MGLKTLTALFMGLVVVMVSIGCVPIDSKVQAISVAGAGDLYYLSVVLNSESAAGAGIQPVNMNISTSAIEDLKDGKADAVLLGREPTQSELMGLKDYVIAYDSVCVVIDENSYVGGMTNGAGRPDTKDKGFQDISFETLAQIYSGQGWLWNDGFFKANPDIDVGSWLWAVDSLAWIPQPKPIVSSFLFPPQKYDTQTVLYQKLGLDEKSLTSNIKSFTSPRYNKEEEVMAYEYTGSGYKANYGGQNFAFKLGFASRRVMTIAPRHVAVRVLSIDGLDPLKNTKAVYDGSYKLARKIHLLERQNSSKGAQQLAGFLQSLSGQQLLVNTGYLPLRQQ